MIQLEFQMLDRAGFKRFLGKKRRQGPREQNILVVPGTSNRKRFYSCFIHKCLGNAIPVKKTST